MKQEIIGLENIADAVSRLSQQARTYQFSSHNPGHLIIGLDRGCGRTTVTRFVAESLAEADPYRFSYCGSHLYLEFELEETVQSIKNVIYEIDNNHGYSNAYQGVIAFDVAALIRHVDEEQTRFFLRKLGNLCKTATVICFLPNKRSASGDRLALRIQETVGHAKYLFAEAYTAEQFSLIGQRILQNEFFIECDNSLEVKKQFLRCKDIHEVRLLAALLAGNAETVECIPRITSKSIKLTERGQQHAK